MTCLGYSMKAPKVGEQSQLGYENRGRRGVRRRSVRDDVGTDLGADESITNSQGLVQGASWDGLCWFHGSWATFQLLPQSLRHSHEW